MRLKWLMVPLLLIILLGMIANVKADAFIDYSFDQKRIIITVNYGINEQDKPKILEVYVNHTLYRVYYFSDNESFPKYIYINMTITGFTSLSVRAYYSITGWSKENEIYVNSTTYTEPNLNLGREIALIIGVLILIIAIILLFRRKS
ncbi:MAG TPA: hypothetical protein VKU94_02510 [Geobacterales bacterium]|nr:hypothetical protein [Geobacterales bacterium]